MLVEQILATQGQLVGNSNTLCLCASMQQIPTASLLSCVRLSHEVSMILRSADGLQSAFATLVQGTFKATLM